MRQPGRNDPCPCGSGLKFKRCCGRTGLRSATPSWSEQVSAAAARSLEFGDDQIQQSLADLKKLVAAPGLDDQQKLHGFMSYAVALQHRGDFAAALEQLQKIEPAWISETQLLARAERDLRKATSLAHMGRHREARALADSVLAAITSLATETQAAMQLELSRVFLLGGHNPEAVAACRAAMDLTANQPRQVEVHAKAMANLATIHLRSGTEQTEAEGVALMEKAMTLKEQCGDLQGLANSFNNLGQYYAGTRRYERAIASFRKDLELSRQIGDLHGLAQTHLHLADLYSHLNQTNPASKSLAAAKTIAIKLNNPALDQGARVVEAAIESRRQHAIAHGAKLGPRAACKCGSGKDYQSCCGRADFEPVSLPWGLHAHSQATAKIYADLKQTGIAPTRLDFFLRDGDVKGRRAWFRVDPQDGWYEVHELPDIANIELSAATSAAAAAARENDSIEHPLTAVLLAVCALEAFINQVAFFVAEVSRVKPLTAAALPPLLPGDPMKFQRETELTLKWHLLGAALCGSNWPPSPELPGEFNALVQLRNEFVHFKLISYEQIVPHVHELPAVARALPRSLTFRDTAHSWPFRVLTPSVAHWAVQTASEMMQGFRTAYLKERKSHP